MAAIHKLTRVSTLLTFILTALITVGLPAGFFYTGYQNQRAVTQTETYMNAIFLSEAISENPEYWQYEDHRLSEVLAHHTSRLYDEQRSVIDADNVIIARSGDAVIPPFLTVRQDLYDSGNVVGRIEITTSLRPLLTKTFFVALLGLFFGMLIFAVMKFFPLRALSTALRSLYEEKEKAQAILNNIPDIAWLKDREGQYIAANGPFFKTCGVDPDKLPGMTDLQLWPHDLAEKYRLDDQEVTETGRPKQIEEQIIDTEGRMTWLSTIKTPILNEHGEVIGTTGIGRDLTERKKMEEALKEREEKLRSLTNIAQDAIVMMDHEGNISFWNPAAEKIFGYSSSEALGKEMHTFLAPQRYYENYRKGLAHFRETGQGSAVGKTLELDAVRKGGEEFPMELSLSALQLRGKWHAVGIIRDITVRKRQEEETQQRGAAVSRLNSSLVTLAQNENIYKGDLGTAFRAITEASAHALEVSRVSIWFYTEGNAGIQCMDLYETSSGNHSKGLVLEASDYPAYFASMQKENCMAADDAVADPRTSEFSASYLNPLGITSMLDVPVRVTGNITGVVCHEHIGPPRTWTVEEQSYVTAIAGFTSMAIEIHERIRVEESLKKERDFSQGVIDSLPGVFYVINADDKFAQWNNNFEEVTGYTHDEFAGLSPIDLFAGRDKEIISEKIRQVLVEGKADVEASVVSKDGKLFPYYLTGVRISMDNVTYLVGMGIDITERRRSEEALRASEERFRSVVDNVGIGIALISPNMEILSLNRQMKEWSPAIDVSQRPICFRSFNRPPRDEICSYCPTAKTLKDGLMHESITETPTEFGVINFRVVSSPLKDSEGNVIAAIELVEDITERKRTEAEIKRLNDELEHKVQERTAQLVNAQEELVRNEKLSILGQLAGSVGHELRNPLGVMNNAVYFLKTVLPESDETVREYLNMIKSEIDNSERIISDLLDFSRTKTPQIRSITVDELLSTSLGKCSVPENVKIETNIPAALPSLTIDPFQMVQVFQNLITNACQAMSKGGELKISAKKAGVRGLGLEVSEEKPISIPQFPIPVSSPQPPTPDRDFIEITVSDTGDGISPENINKLFQPLFTTKAKGIGLGLVVSKRLTEGNGGRIDVESRLGKGTTFKLLLPCERG